MAEPPTYSYSYNPWSPSNPEGSKIDTIRRYLGITAVPWELSDEELQFFLDDAGGNLYVAAWRAATSIANGYAKQVTKSIDSSSVQLSDKIAHWRDVAAQMKNMATTDSTLTPLMHSSRPGRAKFRVGQMDYHFRGY